MRDEASEPRAECNRCRRPVRVCYCAHISPEPTKTRVLVLSHPREADNPVGTARIAKLCLPHAELVVGVALGEHPDVKAALNDPVRRAVVLYPSARAQDLAVSPPTEPVTLIVIDGTWAHARAMVRNNPWLEKLPHYAFNPGQPSEYRIRREPQADYVSTIEALAEALRLLENDGRDFDALRVPFRAMVAAQVAFAEQSPGPRRRARRRAGREGPARLPRELLFPELICLVGEANAYPHDKALGRPAHPHELVQLLLTRVAPSGEVLAHVELLSQTRAPLAASPVVHGRLERAQLLSAPPFPQFAAAARAFLADAPAVCTWGPYASGLYERDVSALPGVCLDLRKVVGDVTRTQPGSLEQTVARLGLSHAPLGAGRGGERMGMLLAVARHLCAEAIERGVTQNRSPKRA
jgi:DTW domain-containing protein YfiP